MTRSQIRPSRLISKTAVFGLLCGVAASIAPAHAIDSIVVTATKRAQNLGDVPVAVTALTAEMIEINRIDSVEDIARLATSVNWQGGLTASNATVSIRGFGTNAFGIGIESSVSIVQDGVVLSRQNEAFGDLFNLDRIEVLRGPQGTLFGKNSSAGVVHLITKAPSKELEGAADVFYGSYDEVVTRATLSGPLTESGSVAGRVTGFYKKVGGNVFNRFDGETINGIDDSYGIRGKVSFDASDRLSLLVIADYTKTKTDCCAETVRFLPPGTNVFGDPTLNVNTAMAGIAVGEENRETSLDAPTFGDYMGWGISGEANYDFDGATLTSITAYREWEESTNADIDFSPHGAFLINGGSKEQKTFTQELRLASTTESPFQYVVGLFYFNNDTTQDFNRDLFGLSFLEQLLDSTIDVNNYAAFGEVTYDLSTGTRLIAGGRVQREKIEYSATASRFSFDSSTVVGLPTSFAETEVMAKAGIQQDIGENSMAYFTFSQGYKGQALDLTTGITDAKAFLQPIAAETVDSYEVGLKADFFDRRLIINAAAFLSNFDNFQTQAFDDAALTFRILNAGKVRSKGIEIESQLSVSEELTLTFNTTFQDIEIRKIVGTGCYPGQTIALGCVGGQQNISGGTLPNAPDVKIFAGANYEVPLGGTGYIGFANVSYSWQDEVQYSLNQNPLTVQDSFGIANLSFGARGEDSGLSLTVYVNNLFDTSYASFIRTPGGIWGGSTALTHQIPRGAKRTFGVRAGFSF